MFAGAPDGRAEGCLPKLSQALLAFPLTGQLNVVEADHGTSRATISRAGIAEQLVFSAA